MMGSRVDNGSIGRVEGMDEKLRFAIVNKRLIQLSYHESLRVAEPHDYGVQSGTTKLLVYQLRATGGARRTNLTGWRLLDVAKIETCTVLDEQFRGSRGESHQQHYTWDPLYARVK